MSAFSWPNNAQAAAVVTINFDGESVEQRELPHQPRWGRYSYGRYGAQAGIGRLLDALDRFAIKATCFIPAWDAERYPDVMHAIQERGHEFAGHGYAHEDFRVLDIEQQAEILEKSEEIFQRMFGQPPAGWRAPDGLMSNATRPLLAARGYRYDSSYCDDDVPYVVTDGGGRLAELPVFASAGDRMSYTARRPPAVVARAWQEEFTAVYEPGGLFNLTLHPRGDYGSGRAVRIAAVEAILQQIRETPRLWVVTCAEVAEWTMATV